MVGQGGVDPDYFFKKMGLDEAQTYAEGVRQRPREMYNCTRMLANVVHHVLTGKDLNWNFPWDGSVDDMTDEDIAEAMERARAAERWMAERMKKGNETEGQ